MSDTPRTDQIEKLAYWFQDDMTPVCESGFVRQLERELNAANAIIKQQQLLDEENLRLKERIKQLEVVERLATAQMDYIQQLEEQLMDAKNKHAALVADVVLYEDRGERIKRWEDIINRAAYAFFRDGSDIQVANGMLTILEEVRNP